MLTDWPERLTAGETLFLEGEAAPMTIARVETGGRGSVLHFEGIETRDGAEALNGRYLEAPAHALPDDAYYWDDLVGLRVEEANGRHVGELVEVFRSGGNEVYRVTGPAGERLVPALRSTVLRIDLDAGLVVIAADDAEVVGDR